MSVFWIEICRGKFVSYSRKAKYMEVFIMKYQRVLVFTKKGNLLNYLHTDKVFRQNSSLCQESVHKYYAEEREIQLIAQLRWEPTGHLREEKCICRIKCPVNPLPVKGEFELPSLDSLRTFLDDNGWKLKQDIHSGLFK